MTATARSIEIRQAAHEIAEGLQGIPQLEAVVLYGSAAHGTADRWSDCDLAVMGSAAACRLARRRVPDWHDGADVEVQCVELAREHGYGNVNEWGSIGRQVVESGIACWGGEAVRKQRMRQPGKMTLDTVYAKQLLTLITTKMAVDSWLGYQRHKEQGRLEVAAKHSADAAELVLKHAGAYRGYAMPYGHAAKEIAAGRGPRQADPLLKESDATSSAYLDKLGETLNGHTRSDHDRLYVETAEEVGPASETRVALRMEALLKAAAEEQLRLEHVQPAMRGLRKKLNETIGDLVDAAEKTGPAGRSRVNAAAAELVKKLTAPDPERTMGMEKPGGGMTP